MRSFTRREVPSIVIVSVFNLISADFKQIDVPHFTDCATILGKLSTTDLKGFRTKNSCAVATAYPNPLNDRTFNVPDKVHVLMMFVPLPLGLVVVPDPDPPPEPLDVVVSGGTREPDPIGGGRTTSKLVQSSP